MTPAPSGNRIPGSQIKSLSCPNCGGTLQLRGFEHTLTAVCPQCLSILDAKDPNIRVLQAFQGKTRVTPLIPLGSRGVWRGTQYELIGFQQQTIRSGGFTYSWTEYLLFNPFKGFRYLTEHDGHWNDVVTLRALPKPGFAIGAKPHVQYGGLTYTHFSTSHPATTFVLGEFPWQVRRGDTVAAKDYIAPPKILSSESTPNETVWSIGEYVSADEIWKAFKPPGAKPRPSGVYLNQPNPVRAGELWSIGIAFLLLAIGILVATYMFSRNEEVFQDRYHFSAGNQSEASFVTSVFELKGRETNVEIDTRTDLANNWAYFNYALINEETGHAYDFGREVSYYAGRDSDGNWTEGSSGDSVTIPNVPSGHYYLRVEPEMDPHSQSMDYSIRVRRDVPQPGFFVLIMFLLIVPPIFQSYRKFAFEGQRWRESDYAPAGGGDD